MLYVCCGYSAWVEEDQRERLVNVITRSDINLLARSARSAKATRSPQLPRR